MCAEKAIWMAGEGTQFFGGNGYINEYPSAACGATPSVTRSGPATAIRRMPIGRQLPNETM